MTTIRALWQEQFDHQFPVGLVLTWLHDTDTDAHYLIPRVEVLDTDGGFDPVVRLDVYGPDKAFVCTIVDYQPSSTTRAIVTGRDLHDQMVWNGDVSEVDADQMFIWYVTHRQH